LSAGSIRENVLRELVAAGAPCNAVVTANGPGFGVLIHCSSGVKTLANKKGEPRLFASMDTLLPYLRRLGLPRFEVDATGYVPGRLRAARPDKSLALRGTRVRPIQEVLL
jgi:hypothetical protein